RRRKRRMVDGARAGAAITGSAFWPSRTPFFGFASTLARVDHIDRSIILCESGLRANDARIQKRIQWRLANQRVSIRWVDTIAEHRKVALHHLQRHCLSTAGPVALRRPARSLGALALM